MPRPHPSVYLPLFDRALEAEIGIAVRINGDREKFRGILYEARKQSGDPRYQNLILFSPAPAVVADCVFIAKKEVELGEEA